MGRETAPALALTSENLLHASLANTALAKVIQLPVVAEPPIREKITHYIGFEENPHTVGVFDNKHGMERPVERKAENSHLFLYRNGNTPGRFEVVYQHSAEVVNTLELFRFGDNNPSSGRPLAFFDRNGDFYDNVVLQDLVVNNEQRHTAVFEINRDHEQPTSHLTIPIDDIYCVSLARLPFVWQGDNS